MRAVVQRALNANVSIAGQVVGGFEGQGLMVLLGVTHDDTSTDVEWICSRLSKLEIMETSPVLFEETGLKANAQQIEAEAGLLETKGELPRALCVADAGANVLVVSQFTLYGSVRKGRKPSWTHAAPGEIAEPLYEQVVANLREQGLNVTTGRFGALMQVSLTNYGPYTLLLDSRSK